MAWSWFKVRRQCAQIKKGTGRPSGPSTTKIVDIGCLARSSHNSQRAVVASGNAPRAMNSGNPGSSSGASRQPRLAIGQGCLVNAVLCPFEQQVLLARVACEGGRALELQPRLIESAEFGQEVAAHGRQQVVALQRRLRR